MLLAYDFEVFEQDWLVVAIDPINDKKCVIVNNVAELKNFYEQNKESIWIGFNSRNYDQYILKGLLLDMNPYAISQWIITKKRKGVKITATHLFTIFIEPLVNILPPKEMISPILTSFQSSQTFFTTHIQEHWLKF